MSELNKQGMVDILENDGEIDFANAFENSFVRIHAGDTVKGKIIGFNSNEVSLTWVTRLTHNSSRRVH